jgi:S1-C subfamily serine protease
MNRSFSISLLIFLALSVSSPLIAASNLVTEDEKNTVAVFQKAVSSVVFVSTITKSRRGWYYGAQDIPAGAGSGYVWDNEGHIVTNYHVVQGGDKFNITFHNDKETYEAVVVGIEEKKDIAVLKLIQKPKNLMPISIGSSSNLMVGQKTLAIGNPFGLDHTMTSGIVSALDRKIEGIGRIKIHGMIQTDASINPGNSGGPLLNSSGEVIGMNTMIFSHSGSSAGVGFAVPIDTIKRVVPQLIDHGKVIRPGLGIGILPESVKQRFGIEKGIVISVVDENGPAAQAGLVGIGQDRWGRIFLGDIIIKINDHEVNSYDDIYNTLDKYTAGETVDVEYIRDGKSKKSKIKLMTL